MFYSPYPYLQSLDIHSYCVKVVETLEEWLSLPVVLASDIQKLKQNWPITMLKN